MLFVLYCLSSHTASPGKQRCFISTLTGSSSPSGQQALFPEPPPRPLQPSHRESLLDSVSVFHLLELRELLLGTRRLRSPALARGLGEQGCNHPVIGLRREQGLSSGWWLRSMGWGRCQVRECWGCLFPLWTNLSYGLPLSRGKSLRPVLCWLLPFGDKPSSPPP